MVKAIWKNTVLAESDKTRLVEGNHYFPPDSINWEYFSESSHTSSCFWKGVASYYDIEVDGDVNRNAAWTYPTTTKAARMIKGYIAFWHGVKVMRDGIEQESGVVDRIRTLFR
jgi:uncharacterized protein (DUF427 family)